MSICSITVHASRAVCCIDFRPDRIPSLGERWTWTRPRHLPRTSAPRISGLVGCCRTLSYNGMCCVIANGDSLHCTAHCSFSLPIFQSIPLSMTSARIPSTNRKLCRFSALCRTMSTETMQFTILIHHDLCPHRVAGTEWSYSSSCRSLRPNPLVCGKMT